MVTAMPLQAEGECVTACIVTYNSAASVEDCLRSFLSQEGVLTDAVVVDNASNDGTRNLLAVFERVTVIRAVRNTGFAAGTNAAFHHSEAPFILFLNPDAVLDPGALTRLLTSLKNAPQNVAAVQPKIFLPARTDAEPRLLDSTGMVLSLENLSPYDRGQGEPDDGRYDAMTEIFGPTAACALWRRTALEDIMLSGEIFDEAFFAYYEDVDLAWRAGLKNYRFLFVPEATATHARKNPPFHGSAVDARAFVNRYLMLLKNAPAGLLLKTILRNLPRESARWIYKTATRRGFTDAWKHLFTALPSAWSKRRLLKEFRGG